MMRNGWLNKELRGHMFNTHLLSFKIPYPFHVILDLMECRQFQKSEKCMHFYRKVRTVLQFETNGRA